MAIIYRTAGAWGAGKGGNLTAAEVDVNFHTLRTDVDALGDGPAPAEIDNITLVGTQLTITLTDARVFGPFAVPRTAFRWRGNWAASTAYAASDLVNVAGDGLYLVLHDHTSPAVFDAAHLTAGLAAYQLTFQEPRSAVVAVTGTTHTPSAVFAYHRCTNAAGCAVTIPLDATADYPVGSEFHFRQNGAAAVTIAGAVGVTINGPTGFDAETADVGAVVTVKKVAANEWDMFGLLAVTP